MAKNPKFPKQIVVCIEEENNGTKYLDAQQNVDDFDFNKGSKRKRTIGVYRLEKTVTAEQLISIRG